MLCGLQVIKANDDLTPEHHQFFLYQMLRGLKYIHSGESLAGAAAGCGRMLDGKLMLLSCG